MPLQPTGTAMHIHGNMPSVNAAGFYGVSNSEIAARRAEEVRKRLLKSAQKIAAGADSEESTFSGQWMDALHSQVLGEDEYHGGEKGKGAGHE